MLKPVERSIRALESKTLSVIKGGLRPDESSRADDLDRSDDPIGVGLIGMGASTAVGRNPGASTKIMVQSILAIAFAEAIVFYALFLVRQ